MNMFELLRRRTTAFTALATISLCVTPVYSLTQPAEEPANETAQTAELPAATEIVDRYVEATGGREAYEKIENRRITGRFEMPAMGLTGTLTIFQAEPNKMRLKMQIPQMGEVDSGTNGEIVWDQNAMMGPRVVTGPERAEFMRSATLSLPLKMKELFPKMETVGVEDVRGKPAYKLQMTTPEGSEQTWYFDTESALLVKHEATVDSQMGEITSATYASDYREVDGIKMPFVETIEVMGMQQKLVTEKVEHNVEFEEDTFTPPAEVQAILDKMNEAEAEETDDEGDGDEGEDKGDGDGGNGNGG